MQKPHISSTMGVVTVLTCFGYLQTVNLNETHGTSDGLSRLKNPQRGWSRHPKGPLFQFHGASAMARALRLRVLWPSLVMLGIAHWCILPRSFMFPKSHSSYTVLSKADGKCSLEPPEDFCGVEKIECYTEPLYDQFRCRWFARLCHFLSRAKVWALRRDVPASRDLFHSLAILHVWYLTYPSLIKKGDIFIKFEFGAAQKTSQNLDIKILNASEFESLTEGKTKLSERKFTFPKPLWALQNFLKNQWEQKDYKAAPWEKSNCNQMVRELFLYLEDFRCGHVSALRWVRWNDEQAASG